MRSRGARRLTKRLLMIRQPPDVTADERALLDAARAGDERAFGRLLDVHRDGLARVCYLMLGDAGRARAAMAETAMSAWEARGGPVPASSVRMWLYRTALRVCLEAGADPAMSFETADR
jgi:hypothetical protein